MSATVILGAGIIGVSTAYYLSDHQPPSSIHLVEPSDELFASASGYAGGFLAKDWFSSPTVALGALSFKLHRELAEKHGGGEKWGYASSTSISYTAGTMQKAGNARGDDWLRDGTSRAQAAMASLDEAAASGAPSWLRRSEDDQVEIISEEGTTAQVDPLALCNFLLKECLDRGVQLHHPARATSVTADMRGDLASVRISSGASETDAPCARLIIAAGAWSPRVFRAFFPNSDLELDITSLAGYSVVVSSPRWTKEKAKKGCHAVFTTTAGGWSPEIFSRVAGQIYLAGLNTSDLELPELPDSKGVRDEASMSKVLDMAKNLLGPPASGTGDAQDDLGVIREGLCFRPVTGRGVPLVGRVADAHLGPGVTTRPEADGGVYVAAGHGPWGISQSLGTGKVLAELAQGRKCSVDIAALGSPLH